MIDFPTDLTPWLLFGTALIVFIGAAGEVMRRAWVKWARPSVAFFSDLGAAVNHIRDLQQRELEPNDGTSIKDAVTRIDDRLEKGDSVLEDHETRIQRLELSGGN
jgi:hypothetical protein